MSCFRCGKELPAGEVECGVCDAATGEAAAGNAMPLIMGEAGKNLVLTIEVVLDKSKIKNHEAAAAVAIDRLATKLGEILVSSGVSVFTKSA